MEFNKNQSSNKIYILGALIITVSLIIIGVSMSYAYFVNSVQEVNPDNKEVRISSGELVMNFASTRTINATAVGLINDSEITTTAEHTDFSVTLPSDAKVNSALYNIFITELNISDNLKSSYLKWSLYNGDTSYVLYIWLSNDPNNNQTQLLNGSFSGKVGFRGVTK